MKESYISISKQHVKVTGEPGLDIAAAILFPPFQIWAGRMDPLITVRGIHIQSIDWLGERIGYLKFKADAVGPDGNSLPGIVFMRGRVVVVMIVLYTADGLELTLRTTQPRLAVGRYNQHEGVAGIVDAGEEPVDAAVRELKEESGIDAKREDLVYLNDEVVEPRSNYMMEHDIERRGIMSSPGILDEEIDYFLYRVKATIGEVNGYAGKKTGTGPEEQITLNVMSLDMIWRSRPTNSTLAMLFLYDKWKKRTGVA